LFVPLGLLSKIVDEQTWNEASGSSCLENLMVEEVEHFVGRWHHEAKLAHQSADFCKDLTIRSPSDTSKVLSISHMHDATNIGKMRLRVPKTEEQVVHSFMPCSARMKE